MAVDYDVASGYAQCDAQDFTDWCTQLEAARERWMSVVMADHVPAWVIRKAHDKNPKVQKDAQTYLRQNGFRFVEDREAMTAAIMKGERLLSVFRVALQPPDRTKCRFCGEPLPPGFQGDVHKTCTLQEHLEALVSRQNTVRVAKT